MMRITHEEDLSVVELDGEELGRAIRAYVRDHLPTEECAALAPPGLRPLRYADVYVSGQHLDLCSARLLVQREARVGAAIPVTPERVTDRHVRALARASRISTEDTLIAAGFRGSSTMTSDYHEARVRVASVWNLFLEKGRICSVSWRLDLPVGGRSGRPWGRLWGRAVVVIHGDPPRDVHATPDTQDRQRAVQDAECWAQKNDLVVVDDEVEDWP